jgi:hypothetical protein
MGTFSIIGPLKASEVEPVVPSALRWLLAEDELPSEVIVVTFPTDERHVITLGEARKLIRALSTRGLLPIVAFGPTFTHEAAQTLRDAGVQVRGDDSFWTEESYAQIRI